MYRILFLAIAVAAAMTAAVSQAVETIVDDFNVGTNFDTTKWALWAGGGWGDTRVANGMAEVPKRELVFDEYGPEVGALPAYTYTPAEAGGKYSILWGDDGSPQFMNQAGVMTELYGNGARALVVYGTPAGQELDPDHYGFAHLFVYNGVTATPTPSAPMAPYQSRKSWRATFGPLLSVPQRPPFISTGYSLIR